MSEIEEQSEPQPTLSLKIKDIELDKEWPCESDVLERHKEIENLTSVLLNVDAPLVFAIDAPWGGGKTTCIKLWQHYLTTQKNGFISLYFNAWENDFSDDPLLPMLAEFDDWLSEDKGEVTKLWEKTKELLPGLIKRGAIVTAKVATLGGLDLDKETEKLASDFAGGFTDDLVGGFKSHKSILEKFKINLGELTKALPEGQKNLIIFVDELDRCRPTYAIETLERIKHLFDIPNIVFVLAMNKDQLSKSIQGVYGNNFDGLNYLKRFIDMEYSLNKPDEEKYLVSLIHNHGIAEFFASANGINVDTATSILSYLVKRFSFQLRDTHQYLMRLALVLRTIPSNHIMHFPTLAALLIIREASPKVYAELLKPNFDLNVLIEVFNQNNYKITRAEAIVIGEIIFGGTYENKEYRKRLIDEWISAKNKFEEQKETDHVANINTLERVADGSYSESQYTNVLKLSLERVELVGSINL